MEGDHGSIVAFRIPCRPLPVVHPSFPCPCPVTKPTDLHPVQLVSSSFRSFPLVPTPKSAISSHSHSHGEYTSPVCVSTYIVDICASLRKPRPTTTRHSDFVFSLRLLLSHIPISHLSSLFILLLPLRVRVAFLPSLRLIFPAEASCPRAKLAVQSRSVACIIIRIYAKAYE